MALYRDIRLNLGTVQDSMGAVGTVTGSTFSSKEKGYALETSNGKYVTYDKQLLPNGAFSVVVWAKRKESSQLLTSENIIASSISTSAPLFALNNNYNGSIAYPLFFLNLNNYVYFNWIPDKRWHCFILTIPGAAQTDINSSQLFIDGLLKNQLGLTNTGSQSSRSGLVYIGGASSGSVGGCHISRIKVYDTVLTTQEIEKEQEEFNNARTLAKQKRGIVKQRINDLSMFKGTGAGQGLIFATNCQPKGNTLVDISGNGYNLTNYGGFINRSTLSFNGYVLNYAYGTISGINNLPISISCRASFNSLSVVNTLFSLYGNVSSTNYYQFQYSSINNALTIIRRNSSSQQDTILTYTPLINKLNTYTIIFKSFTSLDFYVNGILINSLSGLTSIDNGTHNTLIFGTYRLSSPANWGNISLVDLRIHNRILTPTEIKQYHNSFVLPSFTETFEYEGADGSARVPTGWIKGTGSYCIKQITTDVVSGGLRLLKGQKYLENLSAGTISFPNNWVNGAVEFSWYKGGENNTIFINIISNSLKDYSGSTGYLLSIGSSEIVALQKMNLGLTVITCSTTSYIQNFTWYTTRIERTNAGQFTLLIKGGNFVPTIGRNGFTLVSTTGGVGTNPTTDVTYNSSSYSVLSCGIGDRITNIKFMNGIPQL